MLPERHVFLMLTATWCGPCKMLERETLPNAAIRSGLEEFVWVKAYEDKSLNERFAAGGYPTLVFLDSANERVLEKSTGYETPATFLSHVIAARKAGGLPLTGEMKTLLANSFTPEQTVVESLLAKGDVDGLVTYFTPAKKDALRTANCLIARVLLPPDVDRDDVVISANGDLSLPVSGVLVIWAPRGEKDVPVRISAPHCKTIEQTIPNLESSAVAKAQFVLQDLSGADGASFTGRVLWPDSHPAANAIVRVCDWDVTRADAQGEFHLSRISPGTFTVRGEAPGGEFQSDLTFNAGQTLNQDLVLKPVTTVGIRWALQPRQASTDLAGPGVRTGEAYFSVEHSRFLLSRGAQTRQYYGSDFMLMADWTGVRQFLKPEQIVVLQKAAPDTPIFWLFDKGIHPNGLHLESKSFDDIRTVNNGQRPNEDYFKFLRGEPVRKGQVYTVGCCLKDCYAKMEITDVTLVPTATADKK
ncbi:MAG: thioredoxin fold domain-containing protein [Verrucomicrobiota bacterium]